MSKQYRVCSDKSPERSTLKIASTYIIQYTHVFTPYLTVILVGVAVMVVAKIETFEENTEASKPFFLSDIVCCVRVEELENPVMIQYASHTDECIHFQ